MEIQLTEQQSESNAQLLQSKIYDLQEEVEVLRHRLEDVRRINSSIAEDGALESTFLPEEYSKIVDPDSKISFLEDRLKQSEQKKSLLESNLDSLLQDLHKTEEERDKWRNEFENNVILNTVQVPGASEIYSGSKSGLADIIHENHSLKKQLETLYNEVKSQDKYASNDNAELQESDEEISWKNKYHNLYNIIDEQMKSYSAISTAQSKYAYSENHFPRATSDSSHAANIYETTISDLHEQVSKLAEENKSLKDEISGLCAIADTSTRDDYNQEEFAKLTKLKEEKETWERRYELLQLDFVSATESYEREVARLTNELQELESKTSHHSKEIERLNGLLNVFETEDDVMTQQLTQSSQESLNLKDENSLLKEKIKTLMEQLQKQEEIMNSLRNVADSDRKSMLEKVRKTESQIFQMNEEHEFQTAALRTETEEKHKLTVELHGDLEKLTDRISELTAQLDIYKEANSEKDEQIAALNQDNRKLIAKLQGLNDEFKKQIDHWKSTVRGSFSTNDELQNEVDEWREKYESKESEFIEFRASHDVDVEQLMALSRASQVKVYESEKDLETLKSQMELIQGEEVEKRCRLDDLMNENLNLKDTSKQLKRELEEYKVRVQYSLQVFPRGTACNIL